MGDDVHLYPNRAHKSSALLGLDDGLWELSMIYLCYGRQSCLRFFFQYK